MPLSASQIVTIATQAMKCPGFASQAGQLLNAALSDLCQTYDFDVAKGTYTFHFNTSLITSAVYPNIAVGGGPYPLPADFLRMIDEKDAMWFLQNVPYPMISCDLSEYDNFVQQAGNQAYPYVFATDMSQSPPNLVVWPPPSGNFPAMIRYRRQMPDIATPETSAVVPWFPNQTFLVTRLMGELGKITDDDRVPQLLGSTEDGAQGILNRYLKMKDDRSGRATTVKMDRRFFGSGASFARLRNTKTVGW